MPCAYTSANSPRTLCYAVDWLQHKGFVGAFRRYDSQLRTISQVNHSSTVLKHQPCLCVAAASVLESVSTEGHGQGPVYHGLGYALPSLEKVWLSKRVKP